MTATNDLICDISPVSGLCEASLRNLHTSILDWHATVRKQWPGAAILWATLDLCNSQRLAARG